MYLFIISYSAAAAAIVVAAVVIAAAITAAGKQDDEDEDYPKAAVAVTISAEHNYIPFSAQKDYLLYHLRAV